MGDGADDAERRAENEAAAVDEQRIEIELTEIEELEKQIEAETLEWNELGLHPGGLRHDPESLWALKLQVQALMNTVLESGFITEEDLNLQHKRLLLNDMRALKEDFKKKRREALRAQMVDGQGRRFKP